jgi:superfamily I DNA and/or RNA helicase
MVLPTPVVWLSTSDLSGKGEERAGHGRTNPIEARCIRNVLGSLNFVAKGAKAKLSVAILAGYREQVDEISRQIAGQLPALPALEVECNTVDAFQGREADVAIYSVTRSNVDGRLGFLAEWRRLNVALSRGRLGLVIVGDDGFAFSAKGANPFRKLIEYIDASDECSLREAEL